MRPNKQVRHINTTTSQITGTGQNTGTTRKLYSDWLDHFPALMGVTPQLKKYLLETAVVSSHKTGTVVIRDGMPCSHYPLVIKGVMRIEKITEDGHEITLHRLLSGQACELSAASLLSGQPYPAEMICDSPVQIASLPKNNFNYIMNKSSLFRDFVFSSIGGGFNELISRLTDTSFGSMDRRLANCLIKHDRHETERVLKITHHDLAVDLGSAREVISRLLKQFESRGWVKLHRGWIEIVNIERLLRLAADSHTRH